MYILYDFCESERVERNASVNVESTDAMHK
jgi:hypothetical protein